MLFIFGFLSSNLSGVLFIVIIALLNISSYQQCFVLNCFSCLTDPYQCNNCVTSYTLRSSLCVDCVGQNCLQCPNNTAVCTFCQQTTGPDRFGNCVNCLLQDCRYCSTDYAICTQCLGGNGFNASAHCAPCSVPNCFECHINITLCERCDPSTRSGPYTDKTRCQSCTDFICNDCSYDYQLCRQCGSSMGVIWTSILGGYCDICVDPNCQNCFTNVSFCTYCVNKTGASSTGECLSCDPNCVMCSSNYSSCNQCNNGNGLNATSSCQRCQDSNCIECFADPSSCQKCGQSTGLDLLGNCSPCLTNCTDCSPYNNIICYTCIDGLYLNNSACLPCASGCITCQGQDNNCSSCLTQYYQLPNSTCIQCPLHCLACFYNFIYSLPQCSSCDFNYSLVDLSPTICGQFCGDSVTAFYQCDNQVGIPYDGCNDKCQIQPYFNCSSTHTNICSYNGTLTMNITKFQRNQFQNKFSLKLQVFPPLYVFSLISQQQLSQIFSFSDSKFVINNIKYDPVSHQLEIQADFAAEFSNNELYLNYQPEKGSSEMFFAGRNQNVKLNLIQQTKIVYYYSSFALSTTKLVYYLSYCIVSLGWIICIIGLFLRRLQGIQAMFVLQFSWLTILWLGCPLYLQFQHLFPLKYSSGYNHPFIGMSTTYSKQAPYISQFKLSTSFVNNFNFCIIIQIIGVVGVIITYVKLKKFQKEHGTFQQNPLQIQKTQQKNEKYLQQTKQNLEIHKEKEGSTDNALERFQKINGYYETTEQCLMYATLFNLIYFTECSVLLFLIGDIKNFVNISLFAVYFLFFFIVILRFIINPHPCGYFRYSFNQSKKMALDHYVIFPFILISAVALLSVTSLPQLSLLPLFLTFLYNLIRKPYKKDRDNYRSALNLLVMCSFIGLKIFMQYYQNQNQVHNSVSTNVWLITNILFLLLILIISLISMIWDYYLVNYKEPKMLQQQKKTMQYAEQFYRVEILKQLSITKMMQQVGENKKSILQSIVPNKNRLVDFSNKLQSQNQRYQSNKLMATLQQQPQQQINNNQLQSYKKLLKVQNEQKKQKPHQSSYETNKYSSIKKLNKSNQGQIKKQEETQKQDGKQQVKERVGLKILKDENKYVQYKAALEYIVQKTDFVQRKLDPMNIQMYENAYEDI